MIKIRKQLSWYMLLVQLAFAVSCDDEIACRFTFNRVVYGVTTVACDQFRAGYSARMSYKETERLKIVQFNAPDPTVTFVSDNGDKYTYTGAGVSLYAGVIDFDVMLEQSGRPVGKLTGKCGCTSMVME